MLKKHLCIFYIYNRVKNIYLNRSNVLYIIFFKYIIKNEFMSLYDCKK